jgi:hypothetical protein
MHTLKRWLNKLFTWWPWKRLANVDKPDPARNVGWSISPEGVWRSTTHGMEPSTPLPGSISIAIEQLGNDAADASSGSQAPHSQSQQSLTNSNAFSSAATSPTHGTNNKCIPCSQPKPDPTSDTERHLQFLRYLIQRGAFDDDLG